MNSINNFLEKYARFLWLLTAYLGLVAISTTAELSFNFLGSYIFAIGVLNLVATYGLFKKLAWGWKLASYAAILSLIYLVAFLVLVGIIINILILYTAIKFKTKIGGRESDSLLPKKFLKL